MSFLRDMTPADYAEVDRLLGQLHAIHVAGRPDIYEPVAHPYTRERYEAMVADSGMLTFLACDEAGRVQGICLVTLRDQNGMRREKTAYLEALVVDCRYRRQGIATLLLRKAECRAHAWGAVRMDLNVWDFNREALAFYRKEGLLPQRWILEKDLRGE